MIGRSAPEPTGRPGRPPTPWRRRVGVGLLLALILGGAVGPPRRVEAQRPADPGASPPRARPDATPRPGGRPVAPPTEPPAELPPPGDEPAPGGLPPAQPAPRGEAEPPPRDERVVPASAEPGDPLPPSMPKPDGVGGTAPAAQPAGAGDPADSFALKPERLASGKQQVRLAVEVQAPEFINKGKEATIRLVVSNQGSNDAHGVILTYQLPEGLEFVRSDAKEEIHKDPTNPQVYTWNKAMIAANGEWSVGLRVKGKDARSCEHLASVTAKAGTKERTMVREPKLKVGAQVNPGRVLKGEQVNFQVTVHNNGTGPAKDVTITARLSDGLRLRDTREDQVEVEQVIPLLKPGDTVDLDPLLVDTIAGGKQSCTVEVQSPDVNADPADHRYTAPVEVTQPKLDVQVAGMERRLTGQPIEYRVTIRNVGDAPAQAVVVSAYMPTQGGKLRGDPPAGGTFDRKNRKIDWRLPRLEPGEPVEYRFLYDTSTAGQYRCSAEAVSGTLREAQSTTTEVAGFADLDLKVAQTARLIDVGGSTFYDFTVKNHGTKEATRVQIGGDLTNLEVKNQYSDNLTGKFKYEPPAFAFPEIPRLPAGESITLSIEVVALRPGKAGAEVRLAYAEMGPGEGGPIKQLLSTTVTDNKPPGQ